MTRLSRAQLAGGALTVVVAAAVGVGMFIAGAPSDERERRLDGRRVDDLVRIAEAADVFWTRHGRVPATLDELRNEPGSDARAGDPETGEAYEFRPVGAAAFEVCARFARPTESTSREAFWSHGAGRQCFRRDARKVPGDR